MNQIQLSDFQRAIREIHGCDSRYLCVEHVVESYEGSMSWEGDVLVFRLAGHPMAERVYAWEVGGVVTAVLHEPPVESARGAVRAGDHAGSEYDRD